MTNNQNNQNLPRGPEKEPKTTEDIFAFEEKRGERQREAVEKPMEIKREAAPEIKPEMERISVEEEMARKKAAVPPVKAPAPQIKIVKSATQIAIENILSENLDDLYLSMSPVQQMQFRQKGEETASKIEQLMQAVKVKVKEILNLIMDWLKIIPGVNKFFLEQEAKIKTDRIIALREKKLKEKQK